MDGRLVSSMSALDGYRCRSDLFVEILPLSFQPKLLRFQRRDLVS